MSFHFLVWFEPLPGKEKEFREELLRVVEPSRAETDCLSIHAFESLREPFRFAIHSEWVDEVAFELHAQKPHTVRFVRAARELLIHEVQGLRMRQIGGGVGARGRISVHRGIHWNVAVICSPFDPSIVTTALRLTKVSSRWRR